MQNELYKKLEINNFWNRDVPHLGYIRDIYIDSLKKYLDNNLIKVLIGQRRAGKSYIMKQLISYLMKERQVKPENILYINFELEDFLEIDNEAKLGEVISLYIERNKPIGKFYLFFDEIQNVSGWERIINSYRANDNFDVEIFLTGSNSHLLSSELSTYISGRYVEKNIYPFSYEEYLDFYNVSNSKEHFINFINFTGIPELYNLPNKELQDSFLKSLKDTILLKDIVKRYRIKEVDLLEKLLHFIVDNTAKLFSLNSITNKLKSIGIKTNPVTVGNYLKYIENTFLTYSIDRFDIKGKNILEGSKKYYLGDLGFANFMLSSFDNNITRKLENYVFNFLKYKGYKVYTGNIGDLEIDFVAEKEDKKIYIQVAYVLYDEKVIQREYGNLEKIKDNWPKYVISMDEINIPNKEGITHIKAWEIGKYL
ncbi:MAG: ATP-binding protein [Candidatus Gracilibacteria bacterium]|nr:ATP-binding protein [Candidatus Gracilibacteria bacterium]